MMKTTKRQIKEMILNGIAKDLTSVKDSSELFEEMGEDYFGWQQMAYSCGTYGCTGKLIKGRSGQLYAVVGRTIALWLF